MQFWTYGPYDVDIKKQSESEMKQAFWQQVAESDEAEGFGRGSLKGAIGCYVFYMQYGEKMTPYYVGLTKARTGFGGEIFTPHKINHYRKALTERPRHKGKMLLFPLATPTGYLSLAYETNKPLIEWMERTLIGMALAKNPYLLNVRDTKNLRNCVVDGVFGIQSRHQKYEAASVARKVLTDHDDW